MTRDRMRPFGRNHRPGAASVQSPRQQASLIPWALAQPAPHADRGAFTALSAILVGRQALDAAQTARLYDALAAAHAHFPDDVQTLLTLMNQRRIDPLQWQSVLDTEHSPLAPLPRKIVSAWYLSVVGSGASAHCISYETALNAVAVADVLKPPTRHARCFRTDTRSGAAPGSWPDRSRVPEFAPQGQLDVAVSAVAVGASSDLRARGQWLPGAGRAVSSSGRIHPGRRRNRRPALGSIGPP